MAKKTVYTVRRHLSTTGIDGEYKEWDDCTQEEKDALAARICSVVSEGHSQYYSQHPDAYEAFLKLEELYPNESFIERCLKNHPPVRIEVKEHGL